MGKKITDDEDRLKRQARRRLIGAVALTTAIVVILPMVLENEPKPVGQDIELRIPDKDKAAAFAPRIDLPPASAPVAALPVASPDAASAPVAVSQPVAQEAVAAVPAAIAPNNPSSDKTAVPEQEHKLSQAKPAAAAHAEQGQTIPQTGLVLQIGAFSNADTAHSWQQHLVQQGFKAYTEKVGDKVRVRIGPYSTREAANKARHKLEDKGLHSNIVEPG
jgi:DedD protein